MTAQNATTNQNQLEWTLATDEEKAEWKRNGIIIGCTDYMLGQRGVLWVKRERT